MENIDELIDRLARESGGVKPAPHPFKLGLKWMGWATVYLFLSLLFSGLRPDLMMKLHESWFMAEIMALVAVFVATSVSAAVLSFPDLHQMRRMAFSPLIAFALLMLVLIGAWHADSPPAPLPVHSFECTISITLFSLLPTVWTFYAMRKFASTHFCWGGSVAALSAFSVSALWLRLHEVNDSVLHVVEWHYLPMIAFGLAGWGLGKKILKW